MVSPRATMGAESARSIRTCPSGTVRPPFAITVSPWTSDCPQRPVQVPRGNRLARSVIRQRDQTSPRRDGTTRSPESSR